MSVFWILYLIYCFLAYLLLHKHFQRLENCHKQLTNEQTLKYRAFVRNDFNKYSKFNTYIGAMVLLPLRLFFLILTFTCNYLTNQSLFYFYAKFQTILLKQQFFVIIIFVRMTLFGFGFYYIPVKKLTENKENRQYSRAPIIISNHTSLFDIWILYSNFDCSFLASVETKAFPLVKEVGEVLQAVYVDRFETDQTKVTDHLKQKTLQFKEKNLSQTMRFKPIAIFPEGLINIITHYLIKCQQFVEQVFGTIQIIYQTNFIGTCTNNKHLASFKKGAFQNMTPVSIAMIEYSDDRYNPMIDSNGTLTSLLLAMCQFENKASMKYHEYITPESLGIQNLKEENWKEYADKVQQKMAKEGDLMIVDGGIRTCFELMHLFRKM